ncbi:MAG: hypothetical protein JRI23_16725 [Deltaproteobacteria bacterium]|jgi:putative GTP pyrophosphokinase|nr:hypothetical protein [Deltaproteobacteria bacterium]MBW2533432.1 hypothetical protein [Deltaproteobacteria bacterium]
MTPDPDVLNSFLKEYARYVRTVLQPMQMEIRELFGPWHNPETWTKYQRTIRTPTPTPVQRIFSRIKRPEQVVDKIFRKQSDFPDGLTPASFRRMRDALGVRVLVYFLSHLPLIDRQLRTLGTVEIAPHEPPKAYMTEQQAQVLGLDRVKTIRKESGYSAIHYTLRLKNSGLAEPPWFEVQVRTMGQELWSAAEHHLGYKPGRRPNLSARRQLKVLSHMIAAIDEHFNVLYEELCQSQEEVQVQDDDLLTAETLPPVLAEVGLRCAQRDMNNILKFLFSRGVETIRHIRQLAVPSRIDIISHTFTSETGRSPANLEIIATLAALQGASREEGEIRRIIKSQIAYRGAWDSIRQEFSDG